MRLLQLGMGSWGRNWARLVVPAVPGVELVGCVDPSPEALGLVSGLGIMPSENCFGDFADALSVSEPNAALVTSGPASHAPLVRLALQAGLHVIVEKPFALNVADGQALVEMAQARGLTLMVSQNYRFFPAVKAARDIVASGRFGAAIAVDVEFRQYSPELPFEPHHRLDEPLLVDMSVHHFDLLRAVLGAEALDVRCRTWSPPWSWFAGPSEGMAVMDFANGTTVSYRGSWLSRPPFTPWAGRWHMELERARLSWTSRGDAMDGTDGESVVLWPHGGTEEVVPLPSLPFVDRAGCLAEFVSAVRAGRQPESSGRENLGTVALMQAAVASARERVGVVAPTTSTGGSRTGKSSGGKNWSKSSKER